MNDTPTPKLTVYENRGGEVWERHPDGRRELFAEDIIRKLTTQERELTAAREEIDKLKSQLTKDQGCVTISRNGYVQELEQQRDEARSQAEHYRNQCYRGCEPYLFSWETNQPTEL